MTHRAARAILFTLTSRSTIDKSLPSRIGFTHHRLAFAVLLDKG